MTLRFAKRTRGLAASAAMLLGVGVALPAGAGAATPSATSSFTLGRLAGADQFATAAAIAKASFPTAATAVVTNADAPFDAGAASYLAGVDHAPLLYSATDSLPGATANALAGLRVARVVVVGGVSVVSAGVVSALQAKGYTVTRVAGADGTATAAAVATSAGPEAVGTSGGSEKTAIIASGTTPGDLQAIGPMAFKGPFPVLYANGSGLPSATVDALQALGIDYAVIVGGNLAVPAGVPGVLSRLGITSERIAGSNALETAARIANFEISHLGFSVNHVDFARGDDLADALAGAAHAGGVPGPVLLTEGPTKLGGVTADWLAHQCPSLTSGHVFGGTSAVSATVVSQIEKILAECGSAAAGNASAIGSGTVPSSGGTVPSGGGTVPPTTGTTPTALALSPELSYPASGTSTTVTATVTDNGAPVPGVPVDFFVTDTSTEGSQPSSGVCTLSTAAVPASTGSSSCTIDSADPVTNAAGQATFAFHWASPVGKRPIEGSWPQTVYAFTGAEGTPFSLSSTGLVWDNADVTWVNAPSTIVLEPAASTVAYTGTATVLATIESLNDEGALAPVPTPGASIHWSTYRDAACTLGATTPPAGEPTQSGTATTDSAGTATISYTFGATPPETDTTDCLFAFYDQNGDGVLQTTEPANTGTVTWSNASATAASLVITPSAASKLAASGESQVLAATMRDQYAVPVAGQTVDWSISRSAGGSSSVVATGSGVTDANGTVSITDPSPSTSALDTISATSGSLSGQASFTWVTAAPSGSYTNVTVINAEPTSTTSGVIDVASGGSYLRLAYDGNDVLKVGSRTVQNERFTESLAPGAVLTADPYDASASGVSTFTIASSEGGGGGGGGGGGHGGGGSGS